MADASSIYVLLSHDMLSVYFAGQCPSHAAMCETRPESPSARQVTLHTSKMKLCGIRRSHPSITRSSAPNPKGGNKSEKPLEKNMIHKMYVYVCVGAHINVCGCEPPKMLPSIHPFVCPSIHPYIASIKYFSITSSTAQGGGGSFKNRKETYRRGWLL